MYSVLLRCAFHHAYIVDPVMCQSLPHSIKHMPSVVVHPISITITPSIFDDCMDRSRMHSITHSITHYVSHSVTLTVTPHHSFRE